MQVHNPVFLTHLKELRTRLIYCSLFLVISFVVCYIFSEKIIGILFLPVKNALPQGSTMIFTSLTEGFMAYLKIAFWSAIILSTPFILYQMWAFVSPALYTHERRFASRLLVWLVGLFFAGGAFGYWVIMPVVLSITLGFISPDLEALPRLQNYLLFSLKTIFLFGVIFEIPFSMAFLVKTQLISKNYFKRNRKFSYILLYILTVLLVPTDIFSQFLLFLPFVALYESGIILASFLTA